jgi:hypothetical protein
MREARADSGHAAAAPPRSVMKLQALSPPHRCLALTGHFDGLRSTSMVAMSRSISYATAAPLEVGFTQRANNSKKTNAATILKSGSARQRTYVTCELALALVSIFLRLGQ